MNCTGCGYTLWNIRGRRCPECGKDFLPSQFEFVINSVRYCCPDCGQDYYGTGERGHLLPRSFTCVRCTAALDMDQMVLLPTEGVSEEQTQVGSNPWAERPGFGTFFKTFGRSVGSPVRTVRGAQTSGLVSQWRAITFAMILNLVAFVFSGVWLMLFPFVFVAGGVWGGGNIGAWAVLITIVVVGAAGWLFLPRVWTVLTHLGLRWTGPVHGGEGLTAAAISYTSAPLFLAAIPCVSIYIGWAGYVWWLAAATVAVKDVQRVATWRAVVATLTPPVLLGLMLAAGAAGAIWLMSVQSMAAVTAARANATALATAANTAQLQGMQPSASAMSLAMETYLSSQGRWPAHGSELLTMPVNALTAANIAGSPADYPTVRFGGMNLGDLEDGRPGVWFADHSARAGRLLPEGVIAHRFGDWVFTYHGQPITGAPPGLWYAVHVPRDDGVSLASAEVSVLERGPVTQSFNRSSLPMLVTAQNILRATVGLPPLPVDLGAVTAESPTVTGEP